MRSESLSVDAGGAHPALYLAGVLALVALSVWRITSLRPLNVGAPCHKPDFVIMGSGSQAVLQMHLLG